ncbi:MAG: hypothetical protein H6502_04770 [Candidatus Woesearchaeota archaeon]|nr:MAG: hypothetical protein H6502_04770 [Candidatus Woesearchaeota archaeon]
MDRGRFLKGAERVIGQAHGQSAQGVHQGDVFLDLIKNKRFQDATAYLLLEGFLPSQTLREQVAEILLPVQDALLEDPALPELGMSGTTLSHTGTLVERVNEVRQLQQLLDEAYPDEQVRLELPERQVNAWYDQLHQDISHIGARTFVERVGLLTEISNFPQAAISFYEEQTDVDTVLALEEIAGDALEKGTKEHRMIEIIRKSLRSEQEPQTNVQRAKTKTRSAVERLSRDYSLLNQSVADRVYIGAETARDIAAYLARAEEEMLINSTRDQARGPEHFPVSPSIKLQIFDSVLAILHLKAGQEPRTGVGSNYVHSFAAYAANLFSWAVQDKDVKPLVGQLPVQSVVEKLAQKQAFKAVHLLGRTFPEFRRAYEMHAHPETSAGYEKPHKN